MTLFRLSIVCAVCLLLARNGAAEFASEVPQAGQAETHAENGLRLAQTGNLQLAEEELRKAVAMAPANAVFLSNLGTILAMEHKLEESTTFFQNALNLNPADLGARGYLAAQYIQSGRLDEALQQVDELLKENPSNASAYTTKGMILMSKGNTDAAKENYTQALKINPNSPVAANNLANILADEGRDLENALKWAQTARRNSPDDPTMADTLGWIQHKLGRDVLARDQLQFAVSKQPANPLYQYHLAMIYKETKQIREAEAALKKALSSKTTFKEKSLAETELIEISKLKKAS